MDLIQNSSAFEITATIIFGLAVLHTFLASQISKFSHRFRKGSVAESTLHMLGAVEIVFGLWAAILMFAALFQLGTSGAIEYMNTRNFTEPTFVFVIMAICSSSPIMNTVETIVEHLGHYLPFEKSISTFAVLMTFCPLIGSLITEPAAMTICSYILLNRYFIPGASLKFKYAAIGLLFVNISIGGTVTPYAAPPVVMVAAKWGWDLTYMLQHFSYRTILAVFVNTMVVILFFRNDLLKIGRNWSGSPGKLKSPLWITAGQLLALLMVVLTSHHPVIFIWIFLFFLGFATITREYQSNLKLRDPLMVGFFLAGLVVIGSPQKWWLEPLISSLSQTTLYFSMAALTAITDNAALTYLGSQVEGLSDIAKYALVSGSVVGGGLTVIANAPNPIGYGILGPTFGEDGVEPLKLLLAALTPTIISAIIFYPY